MYEFVFYFKFSAPLARSLALSLIELLLLQAYVRREFLGYSGPATCVLLLRAPIHNRLFIYRCDGGASHAATRCLHQTSRSNAPHLARVFVNEQAERVAVRSYHSWIQIICDI